MKEGKGRDKKKKEKKHEQMKKTKKKTNNDFEKGVWQRMGKTPLKLQAYWLCWSIWETKKDKNTKQPTKSKK